MDQSTHSLLTSQALGLLLDAFLATLLLIAKQQAYQSRFSNGQEIMTRQYHCYVQLN